VILKNNHTPKQLCDAQLERGLVPGDGTIPRRLRPAHFINER
jgi:hypothetical protein